MAGHHRDAILPEVPFVDRLDLGRRTEVGLARIYPHRVPDRAIAAVVRADLAETHRGFVVLAASSGALRDLGAALVDRVPGFAFADARATGHVIDHWLPGKDALSNLPCADLGVVGRTLLSDRAGVRRACAVVVLRAQRRFWSTHGLGQRRRRTQRVVDGNVAGGRATAPGVGAGNRGHGAL